MTEEEWARSIESLCESKAAEFRMIGYEYVTGKEIWECVSEKYAKTGEPAMHQVVNDILSLKVTKFMNFLTISAYKGTHF
ncbi:post-transcriptional regulator [Paenibacillus aurantiacus]|uniref:Post-transcriptional regulator n=1 Tax=Paenibacillus aurantiacus TaxID=1936118 RepID=A0ABV5KPQ5_9BACL